MRRWETIGEMMTLRDAIDRLFQDSFVRPTGVTSAAGSGSFPLDLSESADSFEVRASLPGGKPEDIDITVRGDTLTIRGESKAEEERTDQNWLVRESRAGAFQRTVILPTPVDSDKVEARCENGMLVLTLPKSEAAKPKQIKVGGRSQPAAEQSAQPEGQP